MTSAASKIFFQMKTRPSSIQPRSQLARQADVNAGDSEGDSPLAHASCLVAFRFRVFVPCTVRVFHGTAGHQLDSFLEGAGSLFLLLKCERTSKDTLGRRTFAAFLGGS